MWKQHTKVFDLTLVVTRVILPSIWKQQLAIYEVTFGAETDQPTFQRNFPELHLGGISQKDFCSATFGDSFSFRRVRN